MPTLTEVAAAAVSLAKGMGRNSTPEHLMWVSNDAAKKPQDWGFPRSWSIRPNWDATTIREQISRALWNLPTHPSRYPREYVGLPWRMACAIAMGCPDVLWLDAPSSKVRHEYLTALAVARKFRAPQWREWAASPWRWFCRHCPIGDYDPRSRAIAEWILAKKSWKGWRQPIPVGYGPDGKMRTIRPQELLDEIWDADLTNGPKTNPERVFRAVLARTDAEELARIAVRNAPLPVMPWGTIPGIEQLTSEKALVVEGRRMAHCVGGYADACRDGEAYILRLPNSTAEIRPDGTVYQHKGYRNQSPPPGDIALLARWKVTCVR